MFADYPSYRSNSDIALNKTWVEIDASVLRANLRRLRVAAGPGRSIILVVKSDGYGHGAETVVRIAAEEGIHRFAVASVDEGIDLRCSEIEDDILLLHPPLEFEMPAISEWDLIPTISHEETAHALDECFDGEPRAVHVEINTGVSRLGFEWTVAADAIARIASLPNLKLGGVFTHFRNGTTEDAALVRQQMERFDDATGELKTRGVECGLRHAASSYPMAFHPDTYCEAVRPGLIAYGAMNVSGAAVPILTQIEPVMSVRTRILHIRTVRAGEWISYGATFQAPRDMSVAVLPIGYGMGYHRQMSNRAWVLINGHRAPIVGVIGMDMTIVDLSGVGDVSIGGVATVLGRDGQETITAEDLARCAGTIAYEITCALGNSLPRCVMNQETESPVTVEVKRVAVP